MSKAKVTTVYNDKGEAFKVLHPVDVAEWVKMGYTLEKPEAKKAPTKKKAPSKKVDDEEL